MSAVVATMHERIKTQHIYIYIYIYIHTHTHKITVENADMLRFIKSRRIAWLGHVMLMDDKRTPKRILQWKPIGTRTRGRRRKRWIAGIEEDLQEMEVRRWRK